MTFPEISEQETQSFLFQVQDKLSSNSPGHLCFPVQVTDYPECVDKSIGVEVLSHVLSNYAATA